MSAPILIDQLMDQESLKSLTKANTNSRATDSSDMGQARSQKHFPENRSKHLNWYLTFLKLEGVYLSPCFIQTLALPRSQAR